MYLFIPPGIFSDMGIKKDLDMRQGLEMDGVMDIVGDTGVLCMEVGRGGETKGNMKLYKGNWGDALPYLSQITYGYGYSGCSYKDRLAPPVPSGQGRGDGEGYLGGEGSSEYEVAYEAI